MRKLSLAASLVLAALALEAPALAADSDRQRVVSALGAADVRGKEVLVDVLVAVPPGESARDAAESALENQGARPVSPAALGSGGFTLTGLVWNVLPVVQNYNPSNQRVSTTQQALTGTHAMWDGVVTSFFDIDFGGLTSRCPSLVRECPGQQVFDQFNDVGWLGLDRKTLAVTWFGTSTDEADIAANTRFAWHHTCTSVSGSFDVETVLGHENGHVVGLGHSNDTNALMYPSYRGAHCFLGQDDAEGATYLYPTQRATVSGTVTATSGDPVSGATVSLRSTPFSATTDASGRYSVSGVPYPVTYDFTAKKGRTSSTKRERVTSDPYTVNFVL